MNDEMLAVVASNVSNYSGDGERENKDAFNRVEPQSDLLRAVGGNCEVSSRTGTHEADGWEDVFCGRTDHGAEICRCGVKFRPVAGE
jgi:hypothetical protein